MRLSGQTDNVEGEGEMKMVEWCGRGSSLLYPRPSLFLPELEIDDRVYWREVCLLLENTSPSTNCQIILRPLNDQNILNSDLTLGLTILVVDISRWVELSTIDRDQSMLSQSPLCSCFLRPSLSLPLHLSSTLLSSCLLCWSSTWWWLW